MASLGYRADPDGAPEPLPADLAGAPGSRFRDHGPAWGGHGVEALAPDCVDAFLELRPVWYRSTEAGGEAPGHWGFSPDEVAGIDPRLVHFTCADKVFEEVGGDAGSVRPSAGGALGMDARGGVPERVAYDRMTVLLQAVAKRQQALLETLEEELCALAARVEALEEAR